MMTNTVRVKMTENRWATLRFVDRFNEENGYGPTLREIGDAVGISSTSVVNYNLDPMREAGLIDGLLLPKGFTAPRTLHITDRGRELLEEYLEKKGGDDDGEE